MENKAIIVPPKSKEIKAQDFESIVKVSDSTNLTVPQMTRIVKAYESGAYDMVSEYVWKIAMSKLKESLSTLGMDFIGEMLERRDVNEFSAIDSVLTDFSTIELAQKLGMIDNYGYMKLRHAYEVIQYHFSNIAQQEAHDFEEDEAKGIVRTAVSLILSVPNHPIADIFIKLRKRILEEDLKAGDDQIQGLAHSSIFYIRTFLTILSSAIRKENDGAKLTHALNNYIMFIPLVWDVLVESDKWNVGFLYRDVSANGKETASARVKKALSKVRGFDFVPETLRSETFIAAAHKLIDVHFEYNNFYNEPNAVKALANLGTVIPEPAFTVCMEAYILTYIGNTYSYAYAAEDICADQLSHIDEEHWTKFFNEILPHNSNLLYELSKPKPVKRFSALLNNLGKTNLELNNKTSRDLYKSVLYGQFSAISTYYNKYIA